MIAPLQIEHITCHYDESSQIAYFNWVDTVTAQETAQAYEWMFKLVEDVSDDKPVLGSIINFSKVQTFAPDNLRRARKESSNFRSKKAEAVQQMPTALIVANMHQEMYLYTSMRLADQNKLDNPRVVLVKSLEDGLAHIKQWHVRLQHHRVDKLKE